MSKSSVRATEEIKLLTSKKDGKRLGFQVCRLIDEDGAYQKFELYFDPAKGSHALTPGDYIVVASDPRIRDGRLVIYPDFQPVAKQAAKAA